MKTSTFFAFAASVSEVVNAVKFVSGPEGWAELKGFNTTSTLEHKELFAAPNIGKRAALPRKVELKSRIAHIPNSKTIKIRYGPYTVPGGRVYVAIFSLAVSGRLD